MDRRLPLDEAHRMAEGIEQELHRELSTAKITVHLEPFDYFKVSQKCPNIDLKLEETVRQVIREYPETVKVKTITTYVGGERRYINLDLILDGRYSIEEAHQIVSNIEKELAKRFEKAVVTIHSEPS